MNFRPVSMLRDVPPDGGAIGGWAAGVGADLSPESVSFGRELCPQMALWGWNLREIQSKIEFNLI